MRFASGEATPLAPSTVKTCAQLGHLDLFPIFSSAILRVLWPQDTATRQTYQHLEWAKPDFVRCRPEPAPQNTLTQRPSGVTPECNFSHVMQNISSSNSVGRPQPMKSLESTGSPHHAVRKGLQKNLVREGFIRVAVSRSKYPALIKLICPDDRMFFCLLAR